MMKQYEKYKPSGVEWLGDIPEHWNVMRLKYLFSFGKGLNITKENLVNNGISVINYGQVHSKANKGTIIIDQLIRYVSEDYLLKNKQSLVNKGDFIVADTSEDLDGVGNCVYVDRNSCLFAGYHTIILKSLIGNKNKYFSYLFLSNEWRSQLRSRVSGIKVYSITKGILSDNTVVTPTPIEQEQIVAFLDENCDLIDCVIKNRLKQIELLRQERQTIIYNAVTRGIDNNVELKPSGIEWLGDMPVHWIKCKMKYIATLQSGNNLTSEDIKEDGNYPVYGGNGIRGYYNQYTHDGNYALIGRQGALCGNINYASGRFWATEHAVVCTLKKGYNTLWFGELLKTMNLNQYSLASAQPGLSVDNIKNLNICMPPKDEQLKIAAYIETKTSKLDSVIQKYERQIELLKEYKAALISQSVTGAIDVRK